VKPTLTIAALTLKECRRRKIFQLIPIVTVLFLGLFALGNHYAFQFATGTVPQAAGRLVNARDLAGATLVGLSMFVTLFLGTVLAVFLTMATVRGDAEQGIVQQLVVRPIGRSVLLTGRFLGAGALCASYVVFLYSCSVVITGLFGGWWPTDFLVPGLSLAAAVLIVTALSLLGSVLLTTVANGVGIFMLYGAGLLAGLLGQLGSALSSPTLRSIAKAVSWALPFEALYQAGLYRLTASATGLTRVIVQLGPLGGAQPGGIGLVAWIVAYVALVAVSAHLLLARRDL
jgi:Cu-processing system permease protein